MKISEIEKFFNKNISKEELRLISLDKANNTALINSSKKTFDFDKINNTIKTSDTLYFRDNKIVFIEFKRGKINEIDFRLKAIESIISFFNFSLSNNLTTTLCFPNDIFQMYFVYDKNTATAPKLFTFSEAEKKLNREYKHMFSKIKVIDNDTFQKIFRI